jgi:Uma2 family endonuclease
MASLPKTFLTPEQYLEIERKAEFKSEYCNGEMFAMAGARRAHDLITMNVSGQLYQQLRARPCEVSSSDQRVLVASTGLFTYPDIVVVCGEPRFLDGELDTLLNPTVIVEVLSPTTEAYDRGRKFGHYRTIESLRVYLMVSSDRIGAELYTRQPDNHWTLTAEASRLEDSFEIGAIGCRLKLADVYEKVELPAAPTPPAAPPVP